MRRTPGPPPIEAAEADVAPTGDSLLERFAAHGVSVLASLCVHLAILLGLALIPILGLGVPEIIELTVTNDPEVDRPITEVAVVDADAPESGAASDDMELSEALSLAPTLAADSVVPPELQMEPVLHADLSARLDVVNPKAAHLHKRLVVRGAAGVSVHGIKGAIDRLTEEILASLEERPTIVVWIFDRSASLHSQRKWLHERIERVYAELGVLRKKGHQAFQRNDEDPLWTSVVAFGQEVNWYLDRSNDLGKIKAAIEGIELDPSGVERVFTAIYQAAGKYRRYRFKSAGSEPRRNVMLIVLTDEAGNDQEGLDDTVKLCRRYAIPVYVIGAPAPFGRKSTVIKWVDPDPRFDQQPQWAEIEQGPESLLPERIRLHFSADGNRYERDVPIDSGFGPFALTRLCVESGGIFFTAHPNRVLGRRVRRGEISPFASYLQQFFDSEVMVRYQPDYVSSKDYMRQLNKSKARTALVQAARLSWITPMAEPRLRFVKRDEPSFGREITEAQKAPAKLEPQVMRLYEILKVGEQDRTRENSPRWQAGYDLAMGRVSAVLVRTTAYNAMLAQAKRGLKFKNPKNNTWTLQPADDVQVNSKLAGLAKKARGYLRRVVEEHPGTPWAHLAKKELESPLGWKWTESFTDLRPPPRRRPGNANPRPRPPRNDRRMMIQPKPKRKPPTRI